MLLRTIVSLLLIPTFLAAREEATRDFQKTVKLRPGQRVQLDHRLGNVVISAKPGSEASIHAVIRASAPSREEADKIAGSVRIDVNDSGDLFVRTSYPETSLGGFFSSHDTSYSASYDISIPESSPLIVHNRFGNTEVEGIKARAELYTGNGSLTLRNARGDHRLENAFGSTEIENNTGSISVVTHNGKLTVSDVTGIADLSGRFGAVNVSHVGGELRLNNQNGDIEVQGVGGRAGVSNAFGSIHVTGTGGDLRVEARNSKVTAREIKGEAWIKTSFGGIDVTGADKGAELISQNGPITATSVKGGVSARNSFGAVTLRDVSGRVSVTNHNGKVDVSVSAGCDPISVENRFGAIQVHLPASASYDLTAETTFGSIHSEFPLTVSGSVSNKSIQGRIGKGGCPLELMDGNGDIRILR